MAPSTSRPARISDDKARDSLILSQSLSEVAATSGGALFTIVQGAGEGAFARVLHKYLPRPTCWPWSRTKSIVTASHAP